jgi:glycosyltransferase involved in cell wall biosynthesis
MGTRCLFVLPSFAGGGAERVALQLASGAAACGIRAGLLVLQPRGPLAGEVGAGVAVRTLGCARLRQALPALFRELRRRPADVLFSTFAHVTAALAVMRPWLPERPALVAREPDLPSLRLSRGAVDRMVAAASRVTYPRCDLVLASSERMAAELRGRFAVPPERLRILPNPVDVERLRALARDEPVDRPAGRLLVASGRLVHQKGFDRLLRLWPNIPSDCTLTVLGDGPDRAMLEHLAAGLGLRERVRFVGFVANPWGWYAAADAVLLPSRFEGMPNVALEALACGTPVIATPESGGIAEVAAALEDERFLRVLPFGADFARAVAAIARRRGPRPAPSRLPAPYRLERVIERFCDLIGGLATTGGDKTSAIRVGRRP